MVTAKTNSRKEQTRHISRASKNKASNRDREAPHLRNSRRVQRYQKLHQLTQEIANMHKQERNWDRFLSRLKNLFIHNDIRLKCKKNYNLKN